MNNKTLKRYSFALVSAFITLGITLINRGIGVRAISSAVSSFKQMLLVLPPIMLLLGLMDVWIPREAMMKYMGEESGIMGVVLAITLGSLAAGPMYASFPFTAVLLKKGVRFSNILIFMGAWCVTKIPTLIFELTALGFRFTFFRLAVNLPGIIFMGYLVQWMIPKSELERVYSNAQSMGV